VPAAPAREPVGLLRTDSSRQEPLAMINGTAVMTGAAVLAVVRAGRAPLRRDGGDGALAPSTLRRSRATTSRR
jgi:histidine ammonia-lyase